MTPPFQALPWSSTTPTRPGLYLIAGSLDSFLPHVTSVIQSPSGNLVFDNPYRPFHGPISNWHGLWCEITPTRPQ